MTATDNNVWRITGPPENFITALSIGHWAVHEGYYQTWNLKIKPGDRLYFHSTKTSAYSTQCHSAIVGFATVGTKRFRKQDLWWIQEIESGKNIWPLVFDFGEAYLFGGQPRPT